MNQTKKDTKDKKKGNDQISPTNSLVKDTKDKQIVVNPPKGELALKPEETPQQSEKPVVAPEPSKEPSTSPPLPAEKTASDTSKGQWYVVHTYSGNENKAAEALKQRVAAMNLADKIFDIILPTRNIVLVRHGKKQETKEKIFPGYILVRMILDDTSWLAVRTTPGVTAFVGMGNKPTPISNKEVEAIKKFMELEAPKFKTKFSQGEAVKIIDGPFADFLGTIESIDEGKGKVKVLVSIFGRETPVELDFLQITKL